MKKLTFKYVLKEAVAYLVFTLVISLMLWCFAQVQP
jgi:hypothetical protein